MKMLCLSTELQEKIRRNCVNSYPYEACGLLMGGDDGAVTKIIASSNLADHPTKNFEINPALILQYQKESRLGHDRILGHYHSHPDGQANPSARDQDNNHDTDLIWVIIQVTGGVALGMNAFATDPKSGQLTAIPLQAEKI